MIRYFIYDSILYNNNDRYCILSYRLIKHVALLNKIPITGKDDINPKDLKDFIESHIYLRFLGLVHSDACYEESFIDPLHEDYKPELVVSCYNIDTKCYS